MSSGLYAALSGAVAKMQSLEVTTNNLSNAGTHGFKKDRFDFEALFRDSLQNGAGRGLNFVRMSRNVTDFSQAELTATGNPLDLGIEGPGFFKLQGPDGFLYSRVGSFDLDSQSRLINQQGLPVVDENGQPIVITDPYTVRIDENGRISDANGEVASLQLFITSDLDGMKKLGQGLFAPSPDSWEQQVANPRIFAKHLENSNVQPLEEMTEMIDGLRAFEAYQKVLKSYNKLASKAQELGKIG